MASPYSGGTCVHSAIFSSMPAMMGSSPRLIQRSECTVNVTEYPNMTYLGVDSNQNMPQTYPKAPP